MLDATVRAHTGAILTQNKDGNGHPSKSFIGARCRLNLSVVGCHSPSSGFVVPALLRMAETRLLLFGDQTLVDSLHIHKQILHSRENPFIGLFFEQCCDALRHEASRLTPQEKKNIPDFTSLAELNERTNFSGAHEGIRTALLCASQLAHYIE